MGLNSSVTHAVHASELEEIALKQVVRSWKRKRFERTSRM
jgi:hypothetical protein